MALGLGLLACKVGPDYRRPRLAVPWLYKSATVQEEAQPRLGRDWWRLFQDPELNALAEEALKANQDLKAAMARVGEARAAAAVVKSQFFPVITFNPSLTRSRVPVLNRSTAGPTVAGRGSPSPSPTPTPGPSPTPPGNATPTPTPTAGAVAVQTTTNFIQIPFDLSYEVDVWGRVRRAYEAAKAQTRVSIYDLEVVRQTLLADLAQDYFNLRSFEEQDRIVARNVELYRQQLALTQLQFKAGLVPETNVLQAEALLEATLAQETDLRRQRADLEHAIAILLGHPPAGFTLRAAPIKTAPPLVPAGLPADLLRRRPDVAEAEQNLVAANAQVGVAKAQLFPTLRLTGAAGFESTDIGKALEWQNRFWSIGANVTAPIFEGGLLRANLRQARARYDELQATYRGTVLGAFRDVEDALTDLHLRADETRSQTRAVEAARKNLRLTEIQYRQGLFNYLQVIDADRTLLTNELSLAQTAYQRLISTVLLIKALGGGWEGQSTLTTPPNPRQDGVLRAVFD